MRRILCRYGALVLLLSLTGCGGQAKPVKVEGVVTLDGKPLEGARVTFLPESAGAFVASGKTDYEGNFLLSTPGLGLGALPGEYKVVLSHIPAGEDDGEPADPAQEQGKTGPQLMAGMMKKSAAQAKLAEKSPLPAIYRSANQTPLAQTVPPDGKGILALRSDVNVPAKDEPDQRKTDVKAAPAQKGPEQGKADVKAAPPRKAPEPKK